MDRKNSKNSLKLCNELQRLTQKRIITWMQLFTWKPNRKLFITMTCTKDGVIVLKKENSSCENPGNHN